MKTRIVLGLDYGTREFGYAFFQDGRLQDWNVKSIRRTCPQRDRLLVLRETFTKLLSDIKPEVMAMTQHDLANNDKQKVMVKVDKVIKSAAADCNIAVHQFHPLIVKKVVTGDRYATKRMEAKGTAALYPEVKLYLNNEGWQERYLQRMFAAIAVGATYFATFEKGSSYELLSST